MLCSTSFDIFYYRYCVCFGPDEVEYVIIFEEPL